MTTLLAQVGPLLLAASNSGSSSSKSSTSGGSASFLIVILVIGVAAYFLFLRPQQQKARRQRQQGTELSIGDDVLTVGGIVGRVVDLDAEHVTILSGAEMAGPAADGSEPTRLKMVRNAIARKIEPPADDVAPVTDVRTTGDVDRGEHDLDVDGTMANGAVPTDGMGVHDADEVPEEGTGS